MRPISERPPAHRGGVLHVQTHDHLCSVARPLGSVAHDVRPRQASARAGTWGSLPPCVAAFALIVGGLGPTESPWAYYLVLAFFFIAFSASCILQTTPFEGWCGKKDPGSICADETAGMAIALIALPAAESWLAASAWVTAAFFAFRIVDILKPWPAKQIQALPGGWGVLLDDYVAGLYALGLVQLGRLIV